ncbi:thioredoxin family protein [Methylacidimicrobium sp. B4]|uniref:thioredoxin family protein n=1 Tax=Methylacidimicrobium sp. B4 TaxID=2796139 RepID=UPI001A904C27|nr:thioredoxin family protein [Methylacidimicrobium sp. B4]QSR85414.1 thioredoxin family protein [Methylacidimicrobium sp. B4]
MAATSLMTPLGTQAPPFSLPDPSGKRVSLSDFAGAPALLVIFLCNHCPYVKHLQHHLAKLIADYQRRGLAAVGISANDPVRYPDDSPERMAEVAKEVGYTFPYLFDETQAVAKAYRAACTPDFFLFDRDQRLAYRGQYDASRPGHPMPVTGADLRAAIDAVLAGKPAPAEQRPSIGCSIKWKTGNEPEY